jgi:hypothetical protein
MKRLVLAVAIFAGSAGLLAAFRQATVTFEQTGAARQAAWQTQTEQLAHMRIEQSEWRERERELKRELTAQPPREITPDTADALREMDLRTLSPEASGRLLAELGFDWHTTDDYVIVSKQSLSCVSFEGIKRAKLTEAACAVLAITPEEQAAIEAETQRLSAEHASWVLAHAEREEPTGDVVAKYVLPADPGFCEALKGAFTNAVSASLGHERAELLQQYAESWMRSLGMMDSHPALAGIPTTLTLSRYDDRDGRLNMTIKQASSTMSTDVNPWQPFPEAFRPLFPGGWKELAEREGFELPKSFQPKTQTNPQ